MYDFQPDAVYITRWAARDPQRMERAFRILRAVGRDGAEVVDAARLAELAVERRWNAPIRTGALGGVIPRDFVLNAYLWDEAETAQVVADHPALARFGLAGQGAWQKRGETGWMPGMQTVCQPAWELHSAYGCLHACRYCHIGRLLNIALNLEQIRDRLPQLFALWPEQKLYKYDNQTDTIVLEPEYGASETFVPYFGEQSERYLMLYTKSDNVAHLLDLPHNGTTLISWSLSPQRTCEEVEIGAPGMQQRIEAMVACRRAGYHVRARFSPIVPTTTWREDMASLVQALFSQVEPDLLTIDVLGWMRPRQMMEAMDVDSFDPRFRDEAYAAMETKEDRPGKYFFSHELRREVMDYVIDLIREADPAVPVSICNETARMWEDLGPKIGMTPDNYACCCGPDSVPGCRGLRPRRHSSV